MVEGGWTSRAAWGLWSATCGAETRTSVYTNYTNPPPAHGGADRVGRDTYTASRHIPPCPARPTLGDFMRKIDFQKTKMKHEYSADFLQNPCEQLSKFGKNIAVTFEEVKDAFTVLVEKVAIKNYPGKFSLHPEYATGAHFMAEEAANLLGNLMRRIVEAADDPSVTAAAGEVLLQTWMSVVAVGPHLTHLAVMNEVAKSRPTMKQYMPTLPPSQIVPVLKALDIDLQCPKPDEIHAKEFGVQLMLEFCRIQKSFAPEQLAVVQEEFLQVYYNMISQLPNIQEIYADNIKSIIMSLGEKFVDENPYQNLTNVETFKKHITLMKELALTDAMCKDKEVDMISRLTMRKILDSLTADKVNTTVLENVFDHLMTTIVQFSKTLKDRRMGDNLFGVFGIFFLHMKDFKKDPSDAVFQSCGKMIYDVLGSGEATSKITSMLENAIDGVMDRVEQEHAAGCANKAKSILMAVKGMLLSGQKDLIRKTNDVMYCSQYKKVFVWKNLVPEAIELIDIVGSQPIERMQDDKPGACADLKWTISAYKSFLDKLLDHLSFWNVLLYRLLTFVTNYLEERWTIGDYSKFLDKLLDNLRKARVTSQIQRALVTCIFNCLESPTKDRNEIAGVCTKYNYLDFSTSNKELVTEVLQRIDKLLKLNLWSSARSVLARVMSSYYGKGNAILPEHNTLFLSIVKMCSDGDSIEEQFYQQEEPDCTTTIFRIYMDLLPELVRLHAENKTSDKLAPMIPDLIKWATIAAKGEYEEVQRTIVHCIYVISSSAPEVLKNFLPQMVDMLINMGNCSDLLWGAMNTLYLMNPKAVHSRLHDLFGLLDSRIVKDVLMLLYTVSTKHPEVFTKDHIGKLLQLQEITTERLATLGLMIIQEVAKRNSRVVAPHFLKLIDDKVFKPESLNTRAGILGSIGGSNKALGEKVIDYLMKFVNVNDHIIAIFALTTIHRLVPKHVDFMQKHRTKLEKGEQNTYQDIKDICHQIILVLDGVSIEEVFGDVKQAQEDIEELDTKVDATIDTVGVIGEHVVEHHKQIKGVKKDIEHLDERVDEAEDNIEKTNLKVEEIDNKTMTNAPKWSRDLTKLMNPKTEYDWRLLASRLGYSNNDIRGWAQQNDPCMALLSEWYATHKTSEASFAVLTALQEMNRMDGAAIVENAMKAAEGVVEDEDFEYASPPPIFLSYQWGMQEEVKLLQRHLKMAGYECWMDIGQMGGGDKLFAKIDNGIRAAKVIICCTTEKYAMSPNCNREVNLSVNLGKPIIPLLMEKMVWPPKGSMGPIFSEYLFIRFFQRGAEEETKDNRYWPIPKFQELLMQLNYYVVPDSKLIKKSYKDWWKPIAEEIVIDKNKTKNKSSQVQATSQADQKTQPLVFLSYQWGKQTQVKILYQRLTSLGYTVWMDIYQMGGGDSLYDKIDRGLRGCKAIVSCVTPKYAISANCRREVSLADALKKPIIPLLLEQMKWPPDGPMSMVFTELLYINFYRELDVQMTWKGPSFNELSVKLQEHIPEIGPANVDGTSDKGKSGGAPAANKSKPAGRSASLATKDSVNIVVTDTMKSDTKTATRPNRAAVSKAPLGSSKVTIPSVITPRPTSNTKTSQGKSKLSSSAGTKRTAADTTANKPASKSISQTIHADTKSGQAPNRDVDCVPHATGSNSSPATVKDAGQTRIESGGKSDRSNPTATASPTKRETVDNSLKDDGSARTNNPQKCSVTDSSHGNAKSETTTTARPSAITNNAQKCSVADSSHGDAKSETTTTARPSAITNNAQKCSAADSSHGDAKSETTTTARPRAITNNAQKCSVSDSGHGDAKSETTITARPSVSTNNPQKCSVVDSSHGDAKAETTSTARSSAITNNAQKCSGADWIHGDAKAETTTIARSSDSSNNPQNCAVADSGHGDAKGKTTTTAIPISYTTTPRVSPTRMNTAMDNNHGQTGSRTQSKNQDVSTRKSEKPPGSKSCIIL